MNSLVDVSDIFYFFCSGEEEGGVPGEGGWGGRFFIENPRSGISRRERELGGGGLNIFFRGRNVQQD